MEWQASLEVLGSAELSVADFAGHQQHLRQFEKLMQHAVSNK
jgi:hypothetical protein